MFNWIVTQVVLRLVQTLSNPTMIHTELNRFLRPREFQAKSEAHQSSGVPNECSVSNSELHTTQEITSGLNFEQIDTLRKF
jgi:hypothetical protein